MTTRMVIISLGLSAALITLSNCSQIQSGASASLEEEQSGGEPTPTPIPGCPAPPCTSAPTPQSFFTSTVRPLLESPRCNTCHALPFQGGTAPLTIFEYPAAKRLLGTGPSSVNNNFVNRAQGLNGHVNGCSSG
ncbi:MAG: hypothetical protein ABL958_17495, partial [Bdellovibrionia bacterium]